MSQCVLDASALVMAVGGKDDAASALRSRLMDTHTHAPCLIDAEVGNVLRRHGAQHRLSPDEVMLALRAAPALVDERHSQDAVLTELAWTLRHNFSFYDALYVTLAVYLDLPLITADRRISRAPGPPCDVELV